MARRQPDTIDVQNLKRGVFSHFESLEVVNDLLGSTEATFEVGDDGAFKELREVVAPGEPFRVYLNGKLRMTGRAEVNEVRASTDRGYTLSVTCRTKMADARYASADPKTNVQNTTVEAFVRALYAQIGVTGDALDFGPDIRGAELMTGKNLGGGKAIANVIPIDVQQAGIQPPETIFEAVERHLKRFSACHWEAPDGTILVGLPNTGQRPLYRLIARRLAGKANNVKSFTRSFDWTDVARTVRVYGQTYGKDVTSSPHKGEALNPAVEAVATGEERHFDRLVILQDQQSKSPDAARGAAELAMRQRMRRMDAWEFTVDGWSYWNGAEQIPWAPNTVADVDVDGFDVPQAGAYFIPRTALRFSLDDGATTVLSLVVPGTWGPS